MAAGQQRLGSLLVELGFIDDEQLESALEEQQRSGKRLGKILVESAVITEDRLVHALSRQLGIEACDPLTTAIHDRVLKLVPSELAYRHRVLPVALKKEETGEVIFVATCDPLNKTALSDLRSSTNNRRVRWLIAGETTIEMALARHYGAPPKRAVKSTPLPEGTPVITGKPVSAPKSGSGHPVLPPHSPHPALGLRPSRDDPRPVGLPGDRGRSAPLGPPTQPPPPRTSDLFMLSTDLDKPITGTLAIDELGYSSEDLPPIDVPPEFLTSPDAALQIIEAEMPRPTNGSSDLPDLTQDFNTPAQLPDDFELAEAAPDILSSRRIHPVLGIAERVEADGLVLKTPPPRRSENGRRLPPMPAPGQTASWGDLVGGDMLVPPMPSQFPWQPDPLPSSELPRPPDTLEVEDDRIEIEESVEHTPFDHEQPLLGLPPSARFASIDIEEPVDLDDRDAIAVLAAKARAVAEEVEAAIVPTDPGQIVASEPSMDPTDVGRPPVNALDQDELPDASLDAIPASIVESSPHEDATEMEITRAAVMREVLLRFIEAGALEVGPQAILRLLAAIMEKEGLLTVEKIAAALGDQEKRRT